MHDARKALVLAGGGITGIGWMIGLVTGLAELGVDLTDADLVVGTSAGAAAGAQLRSGLPLEQLQAGQLAPAIAEIPGRLGPAALARLLVLNLWPGDDQARRARVGKAAMAARTVPEQDRRRAVEQRLPVPEWPAQELLITAVDARTGEFTVFDRTKGVALIDAVAASCAVPLVWPPVTIGSKRYVDGGVRSTANADLAAGCGRVVVLAPTGRLGRSGIVEQLAGLAANSPEHKIHTAVIGPDEDARRAMGRNALDPAMRASAARAGRAQAPRVRDQVAIAWGRPPT